MTNNSNFLCTKCKAEIPSDSDFCPKCGTRLTKSTNRVTPQQSNEEFNSGFEGSRGKKKRAEDIWNEHLWDEPVRKEKYEELYNPQTQNELTLAIAKRASAVEATNKKKTIALIVSVLIFVAIIALYIYIDAKKSAYNGQLRNFATEEMSESYTNVYADLVSMEPEYFIYTTYNGIKASEQITDVICKCRTVEGKTIWVVFATWKYPEGSARSEESNKPHYYSQSEPYRVTGRVRTAKQVINKLEDSIGNVYVLDVHLTPNK